MLCKRTVKNQITLPKKIMNSFGDVRYFEAETKVNRIILTPVKITPAKELNLLNIRKKILSLGMTEKDVEKAIVWARKSGT